MALPEPLFSCPYPGNARPVTHNVQSIAWGNVAQPHLELLTAPFSMSYLMSASWFAPCIQPGSPSCKGALGGNVSVIYSAQFESSQKTRSTLLPFLVILFIVSYAVLAMLVVEQGRTIESQRTLLREMLKDSTQLAQLKGKLARAETEHAAAASPAAEAPKQKQADPAPNAATPRRKAHAPEAKPDEKSTRTMKQIPEKPAEDLEDVRRSTNEI
jgi:hypothetical protein